MAAAFSLLSAGGALAHCPLEGVTVFCHENSLSGRYPKKPGCCANAPRPTEQLDTRRYVYPDGREVMVYPYGNGTGYQPFWWQQDG